jgi:hypothetical protein
LSNPRPRREALERVLQPHIDGRVPMVEAVRELVKALSAESR